MIAAIIDKFHLTILAASKGEVRSVKKIRGCEVNILQQGILLLFVCFVGGGGGGAGRDGGGERCYSQFSRCHCCQPQDRQQQRVSCNPGVQRLLCKAQWLRVCLECSKPRVKTSVSVLKKLAV